MRLLASSIALPPNYITRAGLALALVVVLLSAACGSGEPKPAEPAAAPPAPAEQAAAETPDAATTPRSTANVWRGDLDGMTAVIGVDDAQPDAALQRVGEKVAPSGRRRGRIRVHDQHGAHGARA